MDAVLQSVVDGLSTLDGPGLYLLVAGIAFGGTAIGLDLLVPEEVGLFLAGAAAAGHEPTLALMIAVAFVGATLGDTVGYIVGRRWGLVVIRRSRLATRLLEPRIDRARLHFARRGGSAIFFGRWVGALRAVVPVVAGVGRMPVRRFLAWNAIASACWVTVVLGAGYLLGSVASDRFGQVASILGLVVGGGIVLTWLVGWARQGRGSRAGSRSDVPPRS